MTGVESKGNLFEFINCIRYKEIKNTEEYEEENFLGPINYKEDKIKKNIEEEIKYQENGNIKIFYALYG